MNDAGSRRYGGKRALALVLKVLAVAAVVFGLTLGWAAWKPMAASKLAWHLLENQVLADEFVGVTADGTVETGLFPIFSTGVSPAASLYARWPSVAIRNRLPGTALARAARGRGCL